MSKEYVKLPYFKVNNEDKLELTEDWELYKSYLNKSQPIDHILKRLGGYYDVMNKNIAEKEIPEPILGLLKYKTFDYDVLGGILNEIYEKSLELPKLFYKPIPLLKNVL